MIVRHKDFGPPLRLSRATRVMRASSILIRLKKIRGDFELYLVDADGTNQRRVTDHPAADKYPFWSPDGAALVFNSDRAGSRSLYRLYLDR